MPPSFSRLARTGPIRIIYIHASQRPLRWYAFGLASLQLKVPRILRRAEETPRPAGMANLHTW
eukprot:COSAG01_NODE_4645_length_4854_cov_12.793901_2_plen_63_part_00